MTWYCLQNIGSHGHCEPIFSVISPTERKQKAQKPWWGWLRMPLATIIPNKTHLKHFCIQLPWSFSSVQFSHMRLFATPCTAALQASLSITNAQSLLKLLSTDWWCYPTISSSVISSSGLQSFPAPGSFQMSVLCLRWPKYWSFSFNISPSNEHPGLISFRMDWLDLLAVQGTLKSLLQHYSSKASITQ